MSWMRCTTILVSPPKLVGGKTGGIVFTKGNARKYRSKMFLRTNAEANVRHPRLDVDYVVIEEPGKGVPRYSNPGFIPSDGTGP